MDHKTLPEIRVTGSLIGVQLDPLPRSVTGEIVHIEQGIPEGPAENSFIFVEVRPGQCKRGRYIAWINLYDIEHAALADPGRWQLVEPAKDYDESLLWSPYGWGGQALPSVADVKFRRSGSSPKL